MVKTNQFFGVSTALATPFKEGRVDFASLERLVAHQLAGGINGLVAVGTTGESPTLDHHEHHEVIAAIAEMAGAKVPVIAGTGSNSTTEAVALTKQAHETPGVSAMLAVAPYYNKPNAEGLYRHFAATAEATDKPIILYSIPGRCGIEIDIGTCVRLRENYPHVLGIKEAGGRAVRVGALRDALGEDYLILSGDDILTLPFMAYGAQGVISVASNLVVADLVAMCAQALGNDFAAARQIGQRYFQLFQTLFCEPNPVPVKTALQRCGIIESAEVRSPLAPLSETSQKRLDGDLRSLGLLER